MSVLQRIAQAGKQEHQVRSMTVPKSLRVGLAKTADELLGMALVVIGATLERRQADALADVMNDDDLLLTLDGPSGAIGGAIVGGGLVAALVQQQTTGRVSQPQEETRPLTSTDAALCEPVLNRLFAKAHSLLETDEDRAVLGTFRFGARSENVRLFQLALEEPEYNVIRLTVDVAAGTLQSGLVLILPEGKRAATFESIAPDEEGEPSPVTTLEPTIMGLRTELSAVLCNVKISLQQLGDFKPELVLPVPSEAFEEVGLFSFDGKRVSSGVLGQSDGRRALMLVDPMTRDLEFPEFQEPEISTSTVTEIGRAEGTELDIGGPEIITPESLALEVAEAPSDSGGFPDLPDIPDLPELDTTEEAGLGELPDLPELGDLPDLEDLPKLNIA